MGTAFADLDLGRLSHYFGDVRRHGAPSATLVNGRRIDDMGLPDEAVREALVNAVVHRDWLLSGTDVQLSLFSDRLEIVSPGRLPNGITPE